MNYPMIKQQVENALDVHQLPSAMGVSGLVADNTVPVTGPLCELVYLSLLMTQDTNNRLFFHCDHSVVSLDIYERYSNNGCKWYIIFLSMHHTLESRENHVVVHVQELKRQLIFSEKTTG